jgi:hypothetical protein
VMLSSRRSGTLRSLKHSFRQHCWSGRHRCSRVHSGPGNSSRLVHRH